MKTNSSDQNYKILRSQHVIFVLRESESGCEFIALPGTTSDADVERSVRETPLGDWRKVETIRFDSI
ncbi:MAG: hypothetical protein ACFUZC_10055 [Chthoniobacteraceae bacterium]